MEYVRGGRDGISEGGRDGISEERFHNIAVM